MKALTFIVLAVLCALAAPARAQQTLVVFDQSNPPFMYATADGKPAGIYPAIVSEAFARMKRPAALEAVPWKRALAMAEQGQAGIAGLYANEARKATFAFSDPLYVEVLLVVQRKGGEFPFSGLGSLKGRKVGTLRGWSYGDDFDKARASGLFHVEEVDGDAQNMAKLLAGRIDAMIAVKEGAEAMLSASGAREKYVICPTPLSSNAAFLAFARRGPDAALLAQFNQALKGMRADGTLDKIVLSILGQP